MVINEKRDYGGPCSLPMLGRSVRSANARAGGRFKSVVLKLGHLDQVAMYNGCNKEEVGEERGRLEVLGRGKESSLAFHEVKSGEKHQKKKKENGKKNQKKEECGCQYQYGRYGPQIQHGQQRPSPSKKGSSDVIRGYDNTTKRGMNQNSITSGPASHHGKYKKDYKRVSR